MAWEIDWETGTILDLATSDVGRQILDAKSQLEELRKKVVSQLDDYLVHATNNYTGLRTQVEAVPLQVLDHAGRWIADKISDQLSLIDSALGRASLNYRYLIDRVQERSNIASAATASSTPCPHGSISVEQFEKSLEEILKQPGVCSLLRKDIPQAPGQCCTTAYATLGVSQQDIDLSVPQPFIIQDRGYWTSGECQYYVNVSAPIFFSSAECQAQTIPAPTTTTETPAPRPPPAGPVTIPFPLPHPLAPAVPFVPPPVQPAGGGPAPTTTSISTTEPTQVTLSCPPPEVKVEVTCPSREEETEESIDEEKEETPACTELYQKANTWEAKPEYSVSSLPEKDERLCWEMASLGGDFIRIVYMSAKLAGKKMKDMFDFTPNLD